ncbi:hypothetical protein DY000_02039566 [Brassica cretica]|uniref:Uncharacterized protein n=1 Tax=Brassica cretica TaxID=69181 RepID=A0ABQ7B624_BRACR|nr:hypothetical protein DY000_02039566 [Brassica cretica]
MLHQVERIPRSKWGGGRHIRGDHFVCGYETMEKLVAGREEVVVMGLAAKRRRRSW